MTVDSVADLPGEPTIVSLSDVHGHRDRFESALLTLADHPDFDPVVERDGDGDLQWVGGDEYVLVVNGDLVNGGPDSDGCLELVLRLQRQAPDGHVRQLLGNADLGLPYPTPPEPERDRVYTDTVDDDERRAYWKRVLDGEVAVAFEGHEHAYVHAGAPDGVDAGALNADLETVARELVERVGQDDERDAFERALDECCPGLAPPDIDPDEGEDLRDAPPQVVGHTPHEAVVRKGNVVCQDVIVENADSPGGEAVVVETPDSLRALARETDGTVSERDV